MRRYITAGCLILYAEGDYKMNDFEKQRAEDLKIVERQEKALDKHLNTKIPIYVESFLQMFIDSTDELKIKVPLSDFRGLFEGIPNQARLEIIKSLIWTADSSETMLNMVSDLIASQDFQESID